MNQPTGHDRDVEQACLLLKEYCFDLGRYRPGELVALWRERLEAEPSWIRSAVVEALYQGRYKAISVEQILRVWKRRGHPLRHFNHEFERVVFGPVDPNASKYAPMTTLRPSELLKPQAPALDPADDRPAPASVAAPEGEPTQTSPSTEPDPSPQGELLSQSEVPGDGESSRSPQASPPVPDPRDSPAAASPPPPSTNRNPSASLFPNQTPRSSTFVSSLWPVTRFSAERGRSQIL